MTVLTKVHIVKAMFFPVVRYGCESWAIKKPECLDLFNSGVEPTSLMPQFFGKN